LKYFHLKKILRKAQVSLAFFDVGNCGDECKPVKPLRYITIKKMLRKPVLSLIFSDLRSSK